MEKIKSYFLWKCFIFISCVTKKTVKTQKEITKKAAKEAAKITGLKKSEIYKQLLSK